MNPEQSKRNRYFNEEKGEGSEALWPLTGRSELNITHLSLAIGRGSQFFFFFSLTTKVSAVFAVTDGTGLY